MKIKIFLYSLTLSLGIIACSERTQEEITTNEYQDKSTLSQTMKGKGSVSFTFKLGRVSKNCKGLGVCELSALGVTIV